MIKKIKCIGDNFSRQMYECHIGAYASSTAFFTFLSLIPMLMVLLSALPFMPFTQDTALSVMNDMIPGDFYYVLKDILDDLYGTSSVMLPVTLVLTIWSAAKGTLALLGGLNVIFGVEERRNYFVLRFRAAIYTFAMLVMILLMLVGVVFIRRIRDFVVGQFPYMHPLFDFIVKVRFVFVIAVMTLLFTAIFTYLPNVKNKFHWELPGALFVSCSWYVSSLLFSVYVNRIMGKNTYGSLTTVVVAMLWMYMIFYLMLIGALINVFLHDTFSSFRERRYERRALRRSRKTDARG